MQEPHSDVEVGFLTGGLMLRIVLDRRNATLGESVNTLLSRLFDWRTEKCCLRIDGTWIHSQTKMDCGSVFTFHYLLEDPFHPFYQHPVGFPFTLKPQSQAPEWSYKGLGWSGNNQPVLSIFWFWYSDELSFRYILKNMSWMTSRIIQAEEGINHTRVLRPVEAG